MNHTNNEVILLKLIRGSKIDILLYDYLPKTSLTPMKSIKETSESYKIHNVHKVPYDQTMTTVTVL